MLCRCLVFQALLQINFARLLPVSGLLAELGRNVHQNHLLRLAREGAQTTVYHLKDFEIERRHATLKFRLKSVHELSAVVYDFSAIVYCI
jgi:hypothetical protein